MCNDSFGFGGIYFPNFTRYACCNPCCDGSVSAERVDADNNRNCCCPCCCCCCRCCNGGNVGGTSDNGCCHHHHCCDDDNDVGGASDNDFRCPCRGGW